MRLHENEEDFRDLCSITAGYIGIPEDAVMKRLLHCEYADQADQRKREENG